MSVTSEVATAILGIVMSQACGLHSLTCLIFTEPEKFLVESVLTMSRLVVRNKPTAALASRMPG